jgi:Tfp pilus assembly protein PilX
MVGSGSRASAASRDTTRIAMNEAGSAGAKRPSSMMTATAATAASGRSACGQSACEIACHAATTALLECSPPVAPTAAGTCCRKMMTPIPAVNPSITGQGM